MYDRYFLYLLDLVSFAGISWERYTRLLSYLHSIEFTWTIYNDKNRAADGLVIRDEYFGGENVLRRPCSVLEMLVAMARRCEYDIMHDPDVGDMTGKWLFIMLDNAGLLAFDNRNFDIDVVSSIIFRILNRMYEPSGQGGFFPLEHSMEDMRTVEIWSQLNRYLDENFVF